MIGRAAQGNPWIFKEVLDYLENGKESEPPTVAERCEMMKKHLELICHFKGEHRGIPESRKHMAWYMKGVRGGAKFREEIFRANSYETMLEILKKIEEY